MVVNVQTYADFVSVVTRLSGGGVVPIFYHEDGNLFQASAISAGAFSGIAAGVRLSIDTGKPASFDTDFAFTTPLIGDATFA